MEVQLSKKNPLDFDDFTKEEWQKAWETNDCPTCGNPIIEEIWHRVFISYSCYKCQKGVYLSLASVLRGQVFH